MIPEYIPVFTRAHICPPPSQEFADDEGRKSPIGWLQHLFLFDHDSPYIHATAEDRRDYNNAEQHFRGVNRISKFKTLVEWEDTTSLNEQVKALNDFRKYMGYTQIVEE
jgi:hypothetical protein